MTIFAFVDIETTGLNPTEDHILEVAWVLTNKNLVELHEPRTFIMEHGDNWGEVFGRIRETPVVAEMHSKSGLMQDLLSKPAYPMKDIEDAFRADVFNCVTTDEKIHFAGFSVHFDRDFLARKWEFLPDWVHHRLLDLSAVKIMYEISALEVPSVKNPNPHRALNDVREALDFARAVRKDLL